MMPSDRRHRRSGRIEKGIAIEGVLEFMNIGPERHQMKLRL